MNDDWLNAPSSEWLKALENVAYHACDCAQCKNVLTGPEGPLYNIKVNIDPASFQSYASYQATFNPAASVVGGSFGPNHISGGQIKSTLKSILPADTTGAVLQCQELVPVAFRMPGGARCSTYGDLFAMVVHLNDDHRWSREKIADWLEEQDLDITFKTPDEVSAASGGNTLPL